MSRDHNRAFALRHAEADLPVFPCGPDKRPLVAWRDESTADPARVAELWAKHPGALPAIDCGKAGLVVLDGDRHGGPDGVAALRDLLQRHGFDHRQHPAVKTPRDGVHVYFKQNGSALTNARGDLPPGVDIRGEGGYVIAPFARLPDGSCYEPLPDTPSLLSAAHGVPYAPLWLVEIVRPRPRKDTGSESFTRSGNREETYTRAALDGLAAEVLGAPKGQRNEALNKAAFRLGRMVVRGWLSRSEVELRLLAAAHACGLVAEDGLRAAEKTIRSGLDAGGDDPHPDLEDRQQEQNGRRSSEKTKETDASVGRPVVRLAAGELPRIADEAEQALIASGEHIFARGGVLVRPIVDTVHAAKGRTTKTVRFRELCRASMLDLLSKVATFERFDQRSKDWRPVDPPADLCALLLVREGRWRFPHVASAITTPTLRPDGSMIDAAGYDPATRLFLAPDETLNLPPISEKPTRGEAERALGLLSDLLIGFPFKGPVDRAVALSGILTAVTRGAVPTAPLHVARAHTPGTGKSHLVDVASTIATGRPCPVIAAGKTTEETEKRLGALLKDGVPIVSIDNVSGDLGGDLLCQLTERPLVRVRILGQSEAPEFECKAAVFATGNNLVLVGDMTRRAVLCSLDAGVERPELRDFTFDPIARVMENRGAYVAAAITIAKAYRAAGSPKVCDPIGSYGDWSAMVRAPLVWLGEADPVTSMETARDEDPELSAIREVFANWNEHLQLDTSYTTNKIIQVACEKSFSTLEFTRPEFRDVLLRVAGEGGAVSSRRLGKWLSKIGGRVVAGHRIAVRQDSSHGNKFRLERPGSTSKNEAPDDDCPF